MRYLILLVTLVTPLTTQGEISNTLPYESFASTLIERGMTNNGDHSKALEGAKRCMAIFQIAAAYDLISSDDGSQILNNAYKGIVSVAFIINTSIMDYADGSYTVPMMIEDQKEWQKSSTEIAHGYINWLESNNESPESAGEYHPFKIELNQCITLGTSIRNAQIRTSSDQSQ